MPYQPLSEPFMATHLVIRLIAKVFDVVNSCPHSGIPFTFFSKSTWFGYLYLKFVHMWFGNARHHQLIEDIVL